MRYQLFGIIPKESCRCSAACYCNLSVNFRRRKASAHFADICHNFSGKRNVTPRREAVYRLKQNALRTHKPLTYRAVSRLTDVTALGVLFVRCTVYEDKPDIAYVSAGKHALVRLFKNMRFHKPLRVRRKHITGKLAAKAYSAPARCGVNADVNLCIVAQWFKMPIANDRAFHRLAEHNARRVKENTNPEAAPELIRNYLQTYPPHHADRDFAKAFRVPYGKRVFLIL